MTLIKTLKRWLLCKGTRDCRKTKEKYGSIRKKNCSKQKKTKLGYMIEENYTELKEAYKVLNVMMECFELWFPIDESDTEEDIEMYKERFATTKLCLELGEYTREDYNYLFYIYDMVINNEMYHTAIGVFIFALSEEYGWI